MTQAFALVDAHPLPVAMLQDRLEGLHRGAGAGLLPAVSTPEFRQLRRWIAQVLIVEILCEGAGLDGGSDEPDLDAAAAADLGSIVSAAYQSNPGVRSAYRQLSSTLSDPELDPPAPLERTRQFRLRQSLRRHPHQPMPPLRAMGWICASDVPEAIGRALPDAARGRLIGPVRSSLGEHIFVVDEVRDRPTTRAVRGRSVETERRQVFLDWLARQRRERVVEVTGYEHPADPRQPDHQHRH